MVPPRDLKPLSPEVGAFTSLGINVESSLGASCPMLDGQAQPPLLRPSLREHDVGILRIQSTPETYQRTWGSCIPS